MRLAEQLFSLPNKNMHEVKAEHGAIEIIREHGEGVDPTIELFYCQIFRAHTLSELFDMIEQALIYNGAGRYDTLNNITYLTPLHRQSGTEMHLYYTAPDVFGSRMLRYIHDIAGNSWWLADIAVILK